MTPTIKDFLSSLWAAAAWGPDEEQRPMSVRLAAAVEYGCYKTLVDIGMLDETSNDDTISGLDIERTDLTCIDSMDRAIARAGRKQLNTDALLLEDDGFHGLRGA